jgi:serine O-acetyltransferase
MNDETSPARVTLRAAIRADAESDAERPLRGVEVLARLFTSRSVQALALHRLGRRLGPFGVVTQRLSQLAYTVDIDRRAEVAPGVVLRHAMGVVIGSEAVVGPRCVLFHHVTIGRRMSGSAERPDGMPRLGAGVMVGAGAALLGPISVGDGANIGALSCVVVDVPPGATAVGNPARIRLPGEGATP